ncbi:MAG: M23 family metallopeptidase [Thermomicrobiales bacterium]
MTRHAAPPLLAVSLLLPAPLEFAAFAAPLTLTESGDAQPPAAETEPANPVAVSPAADVTSVRQRGREAPIVLQQPADPTPGSDAAVGADADPDPGDGPPPARSDNKSAKQDRAQANRAADQNARVWPMPAGSYTFTQPFGCVPQIAQFYQAGAGCPPDRPVVHTGIDLAAPEGTPFYAAASGWVTESGYDREVGVANTRIIIQHEGRNDGYATEYLHWVASFVEVGDHVEAGQLIGEVGSVGYSTGPHLHFSLIDLDSGEHLDPMRWLPEEPGTEGYRGITPRRAAMRLPEGTTAGVPEYTDPAPPDLPERDDLPAHAERSQQRDAKRDRKREKRQEQKKGGKNAKDRKNTGNKSGKNKNADSSETRLTPEEKQAERERTRERKRERTRDGRAKSDNASGEDSSSTRKNRNNDKKNNGGGKNRNKTDNTVEQTDARNKGNGKKNNGGGNGGGNKKQNRQQTTDEQVVEVPQETDATASGDTQSASDSGDQTGNDTADQNTEGSGGASDDAASSDSASTDDSASKRTAEERAARREQRQNAATGN